MEKGEKRRRTFFPYFKLFQLKPTVDSPNTDHSEGGHPVRTIRHVVRMLHVVLRLLSVVPAQWKNRAQFRNQIKQASTWKPETFLDLKKLEITGINLETREEKGLFEYQRKKGHFNLASQKIERRLTDKFLLYLKLSEVNDSNRIK